MLYGIISSSWITTLLWWNGLCNSMKLWAKPCKTTQDRQVTMKSSDKMWSTGRGNGKLLQYYCLKNPMNSKKKMTKRYDIRRWAPPGTEVSNMLLRKSRGQLLIAPEKKKWLGQSGNDTQLWMCLVVKVKSNDVKNNIAKETGMLDPWNWTWSSRRWQEWTLTS